MNYIKPIIFDYEIDFESEGPDTIYKHIPGFNGYQVGNKGDVISYKHYKRDGAEGHHVKQYGYGDKRYVIIRDNRHIDRKMNVKKLVKMAFVDDPYKSHGNPISGSYHCGFHRLKSLPETEEEREELGYSIYDNLRRTLTGETTKIDLEGNII